MARKLNLVHNGLKKAKSPHGIFFRLEQKHAESNTFNCLFDDDDVEKSSQKDLF